MLAPEYLAITIYCLAVLQLIFGFPGSNFVAKTTRAKTYRRQANQIEEWSIQQINGFSYTKDKGFQATVFGVYVISYTVNVKLTSSTGIFHACIRINKSPNCQTLRSECNQTSITQENLSLRATGIIKLLAGDYVSVYVSSLVPWSLQTTSSFFSYLLHEYGIAPAFYVHPNAEERIMSKRSQLVQKWVAFKNGGSFISTSSFSQNFGIFSIMTSGVYYVGINIILKKYRGEDKYSLILINNNDEIAREILTAKANVNSVSISVNKIIGLKRGTHLYMHIQKEGDSISSILPTSSFSVAMLHTTLDGLRGFSLKSLLGQRYLNGSKIDITKFSHDIASDSSNVLRDRTLFYSRGNYLVCFNLRVQCAQTPKCTMSIYINKQQVLPDVRGTGADIYFSSCTSVLLTTGALIDFQVYTSAFHWILEAESTVAIILMQELFIAFNLGSPSVEERNDIWIKVMEGKSSKRQNSNIMLSHDMKQGEYIVRRTGIYHVSSNIIFNKIEAATFSACIAINRNLKKTNGLFATNTAVSGTQTLVISSVIYLKKGQRISLFVKVTGTNRWDLDSNTSLSAIYLGEKDALTGLHTSFISDVTHKSTGWQTCANWNIPNYVTNTPWSFSSGGISSSRGTFVVHVAGLYYISANIVLGNANLIADTSMFIGMITVNDETGSELLFTRQSGKTNPSQNDIRSDITLSLSGIVQLKKQDAVSVKICSKTDPIWTVRRQTGFSIVLVSNFQEAEGFLARNRNSTSSSTNERYGNWTHLGDDPKLFKVGNALTLREEEISFTKQGVYMILINAQIIKEDRSSILLGIIDLTSGQKIICAKKSQIYRELFISCNMLINCKPEDKIKVFATSLKKGSRFNIGSASLSVVKMVRPGQLPWFYAELQESIQPFGKIELMNWNAYITGNGRLLGHDGIRHFNKPKRNKGILHGHVLVAINLLFDFISNGKHSISLGATGTNRTSSAVYQFDSTKRFKKGIISSSHILSMVSNGLEIYIDEIGSFIDKRSSFSMSYLSPQPNLEIEYLQMKSNKMINKSWTFPMTELNMANTKGSLNDILIKKNTIYFVSIKLIAEFTTDAVELSICDEQNSTLTSWILMRHAASNSTYFLSGLFNTKVTGSVKVSIQLKSGNSFTLIKGSHISLVPIGKGSDVTGLIASLNATLKINSSSMAKLLPKETRFSSGIKLMEDTVIIRRSGIYLITVDISVSLHGRATLEVILLLNGDIDRHIYAKQEIMSNGTVSFANSLQLQRGMLIDLRISANKEINIEIMPSSALGIVMLNDRDYEIDDRLLPVVYKSILSSAKHAEKIGHPLSLKCYIAADDEIDYHWFRNGKLVDGQERDTLNLEGNSAESGEYYCEASASNAIAISEPVTVEFYDINECEQGNHHCTGKNQTCINIPGTYKCGCDNGFVMDKGECKVESTVSGVKRSSSLLRNLPIAAVVLVPIALLVSIFVIAVLIYTCYTNKKSKARRMLRQSGSFSEEISLNNEELDQLDSIYSGQSDSEEFTPTRTVDRYGESYEVAYSYDSDLDSTMDLRDDEHQLTSFM